jgi:2-polyprenyl-3-methyl-5-hydroxy-6-metoxy-1,4-benzoquinol methylase
VERFKTRKLIPDKMVNKLNVGCGRDIRKGYINMDVVKLPGVDIVHNINKKFPYKEGYFDKIVARHVIEHVEDMGKVMKELHRILRPGGKLFIETPHFTFANSFVDPTHKYYLAYNTFAYYFTKSGKNNYYYDFSFAKAKTRLSFKKILLYNILIEFVANLIPKVYEQTPLRIFPAENLHVELTK